MKKVSISTISSLEKLFKDGKPCLKINKATALKNEKYNMQIVISAEETMADLSLGISGIDSCAVRLFDIGFVVGGSAWMEFKDDYYVSKEFRQYPDFLTEHEGVFSIKAGEIKCVFVQIDCSLLSEGVQEIRFICGNAQTAFSLTVLPCKLVKNDLLLTNWIHMDCLCDEHNTAPFSKEFYDIFEKYLALYTEMGNNMLFTPLFTPPIDTAVEGERRTVQLIDVYEKDGKYTFDFHKLRAYFEFALKRGISYFEFSQLFTQWGAKSCPKVIVQTEAGEKKLFGWKTSADSEEYMGFLRALLPALREEIIYDGLQEKVFFHISDEPKTEDIDRYKKLATFVREHIGEIKILDTVSDVDYYKQGLLDVPAVTTRSAEKFIEEGFPCILYYCSVEFDGYLSNRFFCMPSQRTRMIGYQLYANNALGFLHWGFNFYYSYLSKEKLNPYEVSDAKGYFPSGDCYLVYPVKGGAVPSLRFMTMLEAFQDYRALKTLEALTDKVYVQKLLLDEGVKGLKEYPHSMEWHLSFREKVNLLILENSR